jgi:hypothetical protein
MIWTQILKTSSRSVVVELKTGISNAVAQQFLYINILKRTGYENATSP